MAAPTNAQLLAAIAALARGYTIPNPNANQTGIHRGPGNHLNIPIGNNNPQGLYNTQLGQNLQINVESNYVKITLNVGDVSSGA